MSNIPHTPRSKASANGITTGGLPKTSVTPSFTFGLSFLPSFQFQSPIQLVSPDRFLTFSSHMRRHFNKRNPDLSSPESSSKDDSKTKSLSMNQFAEMFKTRRSSVDGSNDHGDTIHTTQEDDVDLWSSLDNDHSSNQHNLTSMTSIYEEDSQLVKEETIASKRENNTFLTPNKLLLPRRIMASSERPASTPTKLQSAPHLISLRAIAEGDLGASPSKLEMTVSKSIKRRRLASISSIHDSPNNSIASQIDNTMESPLPRRKQSVDLSLIHI